MELYTAGGWRWTYICFYCLAVIPVLYTVSRSPLESLLALESLLESRLRSLLDGATLESCA
jgi:hypothetical protein